MAEDNRTLSEYNKFLAKSIQEQLVGLKSPEDLTEAQLSALDIDGNGQINISDSIAMLKHDVGTSKLDPTQYANIIKAFDPRAANLNTLEVGQDGTVTASYTDAQGQTKNLTGADFNAISQQYVADTTPVQEELSPGVQRFVRDFERGRLDPYSIQEGLKVNSNLRNSARYAGITSDQISNLLNSYYLENLTEDEYRNWKQGRFDPLLDKNSSIYDPNKVVSNFGKDSLKANDPESYYELYPDERPAVEPFRREGLTYVENNGKMVLKEAVDALEMIVGQRDQDLRYDINGDGKVDMNDAIGFIKYGSGVDQGEATDTFMQNFYAPKEESIPTDSLEATEPVQESVNSLPDQTYTNLPDTQVDEDVPPAVEEPIVVDDPVQQDAPTASATIPQQQPTELYQSPSTVPLPQDRPAYTGTEYNPMSGYGTFSTPSETAGLSSTPGFGSGYVPNPVQQTIQLPTTTTAGGSQTVMYQNKFGQQIPVTLVNGQPVTYIPQGYTRMQMAQGGDVDTNLDAEYRLATKFLGYQGPKSRSALNDFIKANPGAAARMGKYQQAMAGMAQGGMVRAFEEGGDNTGFDYYGSVVPMFGNAVSQTMQPMQSMVSYMSPEANQFIGAGTGQVGGVSPYAQAATVGSTAQAQMPQYQQAMGYNAYGISPYVQQQTAGLRPGYMQAGSQYMVDPAQGQSSLNIQAAQGQAYMMQNPMQRELQQGELISGAADAQKAATFTEQIEAATAEPSEKATVQGQLEGLMAQFEEGDTPAWASGAMRAAMGQMAARGLGASSLAGQAVVQAAMESAIPIAQADAATVARFESQNLSNRQQRAMLAAQQRAQFMGQEFDQAFQSRVMNASKISDIANMNFTAEQQVALENSRAANTMELANLSNRQAGVMAEAAAIAQMDMANLSSRQQAAVQNAQTFLQIDMANMDRQQQTALFKAQQNIQALFTDQAAENAARQFNSSSENQTRQFFASLANQTSQFNAAQTNATNQFNVNSVNAIREFNSNLQQQRDMFNAQNSLVVAQANAQWRQNIATLNTAAQNESNREFASAINGMTAANLDAVWQRERDLMSYNFTSTESAKDRAMNILLADKEMQAFKDKLGYQEDAAKTELAFRFLFGVPTTGGLFG